MINDHPFTTKATEQLLDLGFLNVTRRTLEAPGGEPFNRIVVEHPGAVAVVAIIDDDVILVHQYRVAAGQRILEIPAGKLDLDGEAPADAAIRELAEETGFRANTITHLTDIWTTVGFCNERISIFLSEDVQPGVAQPVGPEEVDAQIVRLPLSDAVDLVRTGRITDAKSAVGLLLVANARAAT